MVIGSALTSLTIATLLQFFQKEFGISNSQSPLNWENFANTGGALFFVGLTLFFYSIKRDFLYSMLVSSLLVGVVMYFVFPSFVFFMAIIFIGSLVLIYLRER